MPLSPKFETAKMPLSPKFKTMKLPLSPKFGHRNIKNRRR